MHVSIHMCIHMCGEPLARVRRGHRRSLRWRRLQLWSQRAYQKQIELIGATGQPAEKGRGKRGERGRVKVGVAH